MFLSKDYVLMKIFDCDKKYVIKIYDGKATIDKYIDSILDSSFILYPTKDLVVTAHAKYGDTNLDKDIKAKVKAKMDKTKFMSLFDLPDNHPLILN